MTKMEKLFRKISKSSVFEDRREYDVEDLAHAYLLKHDEAVELHRLIQDAFKA